MAGVTWSSNPQVDTTSSQAHTLLTLPLEIRTRIYEHVFGEAELNVIGSAGVMIEGTRPGVSSGNAYRSTLLVSKQFRNEARPILLKQTVVLIQDSRKSKLKQVWPVAVAPRQIGFISASLIGWMPWGQVEAYSKAATVQLRISTLGKHAYDWRWFSLKHFRNLRTLRIEWDDGYVSFSQDDGGHEDPPDLEKIAAHKGTIVFQWAKDRLSGCIGSPERIAEVLDLPPDVQIRTRIMCQTMSGKPRADVKLVGVSLRSRCLFRSKVLTLCSIASLMSRSRRSRSLSTRSYHIELSEKAIWDGHTGSISV